MLFARLLTGWTALVWISYGSWLILDPTRLAFMGITFPHWSVTVEVFAMYGWLQAALGVFALLGTCRPQQYLRANVVLWSLLFTALSVGRLIGLGLFGGDYTLVPGSPQLPTDYNTGALYFYELPCAMLFLTAWWRLRKQDDT